jgi:hypothetical protein
LPSLFNQEHEQLEREAFEPNRVSIAIKLETAIIQREIVEANLLVALIRQCGTPTPKLVLDESLEPPGILGNGSSQILLCRAGRVKQITINFFRSIQMASDCLHGRFPSSGARSHSLTGFAHSFSGERGEPVSGGVREMGKILEPLKITRRVWALHLTAPQKHAYHKIRYQPHFFS